MPYTLDPEVAAVFEALADQLGAIPVPARGDWKTVRANGEAAPAEFRRQSPATRTGGLGLPRFDLVDSQGAWSAGGFAVTT